ncbi:MAG: pyridoxamine 5'-phosphate oxidase family protein [Halodesulfurarchaeum sp.]
MGRTISEEAESLLESEPLVGHLATSHDGKPHVAPLWFDYRNGAIEIVTTGRKLANIEQNPRVALSVQKDDEGTPVWGMTIRGTATVIEDDETGRTVLHRINRRYGAEEDAYSENTPVRIDIGSVEHWQY